MVFNWTIDLGTVIQFVVLLAAFSRAHVSNRERLTKIETRLDYIEASVGVPKRR